MGHQKRQSTWEMNRRILLSQARHYDPLQRRPIVALHSQLHQQLYDIPVVRYCSLLCVRVEPNLAQQTDQPPYQRHPLIHAVQFPSSRDFSQPLDKTGLQHVAEVAVRAALHLTIVLYSSTPIIPISLDLVGGGTVPARTCLG